MSLGHYFREQRNPYLLGLLRVTIAALLLLQTLKAARTMLLRGYFGDVFHLPLLPEALVPNSDVYAVLLAAQVVLCGLSIAGVAARKSLLIAAITGLYLLACDRLQYHNNRYVLLLVALLVALAPCDRSHRSLLRLRRREASTIFAPAPRWAAYLIGVQLSLVYLSSSVGKLLDADWRGGRVMQLRFAVVDSVAWMDWLPAPLRSTLHSPTFGQLASACAIASELTLALGLWLPKTRVFALWLGVVFHIGIELSAQVELFSYTMLGAYVVFARPELEERRLRWAARAERLSAVWRRLDWLRRFRHEGAVEQAELCVVVDREGREHRGLGAWRELARATPLLFPLWLPLRLLTLRR